MSFLELDRVDFGYGSGSDRYDVLTDWIKGLFKPSLEDESSFEDALSSYENELFRQSGLYSYQTALLLLSL